MGLFKFKLLQLPVQFTIPSPPKKSYPDMSKRPAEDSEDDVVIVGGKAEAAVKAKPKKAAPKKAKKNEGGEEEAAAPKAKKAVKLKPFTPEEVEIAKGASMERNAQIVAFLETVAQGYKDEAAWFKVANAKKAIASVKALTEPIRVAQELGSLDGCGKGTIEKVAVRRGSWGLPLPRLARNPRLMSQPP